MHDQLLWLFINTNQVAGYFGSDGLHGAYNTPTDALSAFQGTFEGDYFAHALEEMNFH